MRATYYRGAGCAFTFRAAPPTVVKGGALFCPSSACQVDCAGNARRRCSENPASREAKSARGTEPRISAQRPGPSRAGRQKSRSGFPDRLYLKMCRPCLQQAYACLRLRRPRPSRPTPSSASVAGSGTWVGRPPKFRVPPPLVMLKPLAVAVTSVLTLVNDENPVV